MREDLPRNKQRTALLIRCTVEEAEKIRKAAQRDRRTLSGYVLNAVMNKIAVQESLKEQFEKKIRKAGRSDQENL